MWIRWDLVGAALAVAGDVLILGRAVSGPDFDRAVGVIPPGVGDGDRWRSLWNGVVHSRGRMHAGTVTGVVGIALLSTTGLAGVARQIDPGPLRSWTKVTAATFAVSGIATHVACGSVISAHQQGSTRPSTSLLAASAAGCLLSLAALSAALTVAAARGRRPVPTRWSTVGPFPPVLATLLTFGHLPHPIGGYARPASISLGLLAYFLAAGQINPHVP